MHRDLELDLDVSDLVAGEPDRSRLREVFREFELRDPLRRLEEALGDAEAAAPHVEVPAPEALTARVTEGTVADLATLAGDELAVVVRAPEVPEGALFAGEGGEPWRFAAAGADAVLAGPCDGAASVVTALADRPAVVHDAKALGEVPAVLVHDTMVAAYLLDPARRGYPFSELVEERGLGAATDDPVAADALTLRELAASSASSSRSAVSRRCSHDVELPLVRVLRGMEVEGLKLDKPRLAAISERVKADALELEREIWELAGEEFTIGSPQQLAEILFVKLGLSRKRRGKTGFSTDARVLQAIRGEHPIIEKIERWRELTKLASTYLDTLPELCDERDRIHTTFSQVVAATGRLSSTNPNLQNIPIRTALGREIRACFRAEDGSAADLLRLLAGRAAGARAHRRRARAEGDLHARRGRAHRDRRAGLRRRGRPATPGCAARRRWSTTGSSTGSRLRACRPPADPAGGGGGVHRALPRPLPGVRRSSRRRSSPATELGYVTTLFGRRRPIPEIRARNRQTRQLGERLAVNTVIQGSAADIIKVAMVRCANALQEAGLATRLILQIHDELLFEGPAEEARGGGRARVPPHGRGLRPRPAADRRRRAPARTGWRPSSVVDRGLAVVLTASVGGLIALQAPINSRLGKTVGTFPAASISFLIGTVLLVGIALLAGGFGRVGEVRHLSFVYLLGGVLGAAYVTTVLVTVRTLGAGGVTAATIAGQLTLSLVVDQLGLLGVAKHPVTAARVAGVLLLATGTFLVVRE